MKIYIPQPIAEEGENFLKGKGYEIFRGSGKIDKESIKNDIKDVDGMILRTLKVDKEVLDEAQNIKIIARHGAGYDNIDWEYANKLGIQTSYSPNSTSLSVAEYVITAILTLSKKFSVFENELRKDNFNFKFTYKANDVAGKTLGIIGFGKIGKQVAKAASEGLGMKVVTLDNSKNDVPTYVSLVNFERLIETSDFITIHVPANESTYNMINKSVFDKMKNRAYLINASRGGVMNEADLVSAMKEKQIAGAVIDVFEIEPPSIDNELFDLENVILTPHIASNTEECMNRIALDCAEDVHRVLTSKKTKYPIIN